MNISRRNFLKIGGTAIGVASGFLNLGCLEKAVKEEISAVELSDLIRNPKLYDRERIITEGFPEYAGKREFEEPQYSYDASGKVTDVSISKKNYTTHKLHTKPNPNSDYLFIAE